MRILIDGYNLMHAAGVPSRRGPDGLRKVRQRFLNLLADLLGASDAHLTTVVFDANQAPEHLARETSHKGMTVLFAVGDENADARIEQLIARYSAPKQLRVVSSDHRVKDAARRRRASVQTSEEFWSELQDRKARRNRPGRETSESSRPAQPVSDDPSASTQDDWLAVFGYLDREPETRDALSSADFVPTDEQIDQIAREVDRENW